MEVKLEPATKCGSCRNESICKYAEEMTKVQIATNNIEISTQSPVTVKADCISYEKRAQKQDGIVYR